MRRENRKLRTTERRFRRLHIRATLRRLDKNERASLTLIHTEVMQSVDRTKGRDFDSYCCSKAAVTAKWFVTEEAIQFLAWLESSKQVFTDLRIRAVQYLHRSTGNWRESTGRSDCSGALGRAREWREPAKCLSGALRDFRIVIKEPLLFLTLVRRQSLQTPSRVIFICLVTALALSQGQERNVHWALRGLSVKAWSASDPPVRQEVTETASENSDATGESVAINNSGPSGTAFDTADSIRRRYQSSTPAENSTSSTGWAGASAQVDVAVAGISSVGLQNRGAANIRPEEPSFVSWGSSSASRSTMTSDPSSGDGLSDCVAHRVGHDRLTSVQLAVLLRTGWKFIARGDIATARVAFRRAAAACDTDATFAMGKSYDPTTLKTLGGDVNAADIPVAIWWYKKAAQLGSAEAADQLALLLGSQ